MYALNLSGKQLDVEGKICIPSKQKENEMRKTGAPRKTKDLQCSILKFAQE